jgi:hypothetical protein
MPTPIAQATRHALLFAEPPEPPPVEGRQAGDDRPTSHSTKAEIVAWLDAQGVDEALGNLTKADLLAMVDQQK